MTTWLQLPLAFVGGFILGSSVIFLYLRSQLKFYKQYIEKRLSLMDISSALRHPSASAINSQ